ncbi:helix-turn-helix domain-containing protein [Saccharopolyspora sp. NPDC002376]
MRKSADQVRRFIRAERERRGWSQGDLAEAAGVARNTVASLERGLALREGKEAAIERALGWRLGSIDTLRNGGEPTPAEAQPSPPPELRDDVERQIWAITDLPEDLRWTYIYLRRDRSAAERPQPNAG